MLRPVPWSPNSCPVLILLFKLGALQAATKLLMLVEGAKMLFSLKPVRASGQILKAFHHLSLAIWALPFIVVTVHCRLTPRET